MPLCELVAKGEVVDTVETLHGAKYVVDGPPGVIEALRRASP